MFHLLLLGFFLGIQAECSLVNSTISAFKDCVNKEDLETQQRNFGNGTAVVAWIFLAIILFASFLWCLCNIYRTCKSSPSSSPPSVSSESSV